MIAAMATRLEQLEELLAAWSAAVPEAQGASSSSRGK